MDNVARDLNIEIQLDWKILDHESLLNSGGAAIIRKYNASIFDMLQKIYPEINWHVFDRKHIPHGFRNSPQYQRNYLSDLQRNFFIQNKDDWYRLSCEQISQAMGREMKKKNLLEMLRNNFPEEDWNLGELSKRNKKARQRWLFLKIQEIFNTEEILENIRHKSVKRNSGTLLELDIFFPNLDFALEFHGEQHYQEFTTAGFISYTTQKNLDEEKLQLCANNGIKLLIIPHWWDNSTESLVATILQKFPELGQKMTLKRENPEDFLITQSKS